MAAETMETARDTVDVTLQTGLVALVDRLLIVISDVAPEAEPYETATFQARIAQHRRRIIASSSGPDLANEAEACTKTCEQYLRRSLGYYTDREAEFTEIIMILREAAGLMAGDAEAFNA